MKMPTIQQLLNILDRKPIKYGIVVVLILLLVIIAYKRSQKQEKGNELSARANFQSERGIEDSLRNFRDDTTRMALTDEVIEYEVVKDTSNLASYYEIPELKEWYTNRVMPPALDLNMDLSGKTYMELRLLRNEIFARNGYLFNNAALRAYFNQFKWYQPVFDIDSFKVQINQKEKDLLDKITNLMKEKYSKPYIDVAGNKMVNIDYAVNLIQFSNLHDSLTHALKTKNFALASANNEQLFYVYDQNQYGYIPNFITTDLYLQVLHKYLSGLMQEMEEQKLVGIAKEMMQNLFNTSKGYLQKNNDKRMTDAVKWANTYLAIGLTAIKGSNETVDPAMIHYYKDEIKKINDAKGANSEFLNKDIYYYSQFKPRGNYTKTDELKKYFRCVKWLNSAPMNIDDEQRFLASLLIAYWIKNDKVCTNDYSIFSKAIELLTGTEDNYSISHLINILNENNIDKIDDLFNPQTIDNIKSQLAKLDIKQLPKKAGNEIAKKEFSKKFVLFTAGRYTFDADILIHLVHALRPNPKRPFPKGLDVFAALGNKTAQDILFKEYKESEKWSEYSDSLEMLKRNFIKYDNWNRSIYNKTMECINSINYAGSIVYPVFMKSRFWQKKNLNTSLAAWAELKHDMILYMDQPSAAEAGEGGGPPPPVHLSYVEPNISFWKKAMELLEYQSKQLSEIGLISEESRKINSDLKELASFLLEISNKELRKELLAKKEFNELSWIGGRVERITFEIIHTDYLPEREKQIALVADVYNNNDVVLEEAVGLADEIYVIAEINGLPYLTKGACFSYYEFQNSSILTDEEWQQMIANKKTPKRPDWLNEIYVESPSLESKPGHKFYEFIEHK